MTAAGVEETLPDAKQPKRWWQWILLYPTLAISLLTAVPQWWDRSLAIYHNTRGSSFAAAEKQQEMWRRNLSCSALPFDWYQNPNNIKVDAVICKSGDVFVRASTPESQSFYQWIPLDDVVQQQKGSALEASANAAVPSRLTRTLVMESDAKPPIVLAQMQAVVVCQRFLDQRYLLRHVRTPAGCFDDVIDTLSNVRTQHISVPCRSSC